MAGDPNARRDKALESIARSLDGIEKQLKRIADDGRRLKFTNSPPDPFAADIPQEPEPSKDAAVQMTEVEKPPQPDYPKSDHPYFKRSITDG